MSLPCSFSRGIPSSKIAPNIPSPNARTRIEVSRLDVARHFGRRGRRIRLSGEARVERASVEERGASVDRFSLLL